MPTIKARKQSASFTRHAAIARLRCEKTKKLGPSRTVRRPSTGPTPCRSFLLLWTPALNPFRTAVICLARYDSWMQLQPEAA
jgi:hypothetical protein